MNAIKERMIKIISVQPEDSSFDEILCELSMNSMIQKGLDDSRNDRVTSTSDLRKEITKW